MSSHIYDAIARRSGRFWHIEVPEVGRVTQATKATEVEEMARDLISIMTDAAADSFEVQIHWMLPEDVEKHLLLSAELRENAARSNAESAWHVRLAAHSLQETGLSVREIGRVLGMSYQRAHQLVTAATDQPAKHPSVPRAR